MIIMATATGRPAPSNFYRSAICGGLLMPKRASASQATAVYDVQRSPAEHRAVLDNWRDAAPKHDHEVFGRKLETKRSRHRALAELGALISFRNRPIGVSEGVPAEDVPPIRTNWNLVPANDNKQPEEGFDTERTVEFEPSMDLIEREIADLPMRHRAEPAIYRQSDGSNIERLASREIHGIPHSNDVEYGCHVDDTGNRHKVIVRIGKLRFSDGSQTERDKKLVLDQVVDHDFRMPVGAMLNAREKSVADRGSAIDTSGSNAHYRWMVKAQLAAPHKTSRNGRVRKTISKDEARRVLAEAYANSPNVSVIKYPDGLPHAPSNLRMLFIGGRKGKNGESGSQAWQDIFSEKENRDTFAKAIDAMQDDYVRVLTEASTAKSLGQLGAMRGFRGRHAIDAGRRLLVAANDNFERAMQIAKYAAEA